MSGLILLRHWLLGPSQVEKAKTSKCFFVCFVNCSTPRMTSSVCTQEVLSNFQMEKAVKIELEGP